MSDSLCPKCGFTRDEIQDQCLKCGLIFAKYRLRPESGPELSLPLAAAEVLDPARQELRVRVLALPLTLLVAWLLVISPLSHLVRIFLSMWVHELGHAVSAWFCGFGAFPGPWFTPVSAERMISVSALLAALVLAWIYRSWREERWFLGGVGILLLLLQVVGTRLPEHLADAVVLFGGDAGCFVLGTLLMATFYAPEANILRHGALRWGLLPIGAAAFMDAFHTWWGARSDVGMIPFGENEGGAVSDPSRLMDEYGWSVHDLVQRNLTLALSCLALLALIYLWGIYRETRR